MKNSTRHSGALVSLASLIFFLQAQDLSAQQVEAAKNKTAARVAAEPQAASQSVSSPPQVLPALPVPRLIKFSGVAKDASGQPRSGVVGLTFSIYKEQEGGATLWMETQNVELSQGRYAVLLGSTQSEGMPLELFAAGEPRWLGVKVELPGEVEQARVLLVSVPYALKAADAENLGGKPASAYALAPQEAAADTGATGGQTAMGTSGAGTKPTKSTKAGTTGNATTMNFIPMFTDDAGTLGNSVIIQSGSNIGIGGAPGPVTLDVNGGVRGTGLSTAGRGIANDAINTNALFLNGSNGLGVFGTNNLVLGAGVIYTKTSIYSGGLERVTVDGTTGSVGIGPNTSTTTAGLGLDVNGGVRGSGLSTAGRNISPDTINTNSLFLNGSNAMGVIGTNNLAFGPGVLFTKVSFFASNGASSTERMTVLGATGNVGIGTQTPGARLDVAGGSVRTDTQLISTVATGTAPLSVASTTMVPNLNAAMLGGNLPSAFAQLGAANTFVGNQTINGSVTVTGLSIAPTGIITFANGQTFPVMGMNGGTVTSVMAGAGLVAAPANITTSGTISIAAGGVTNAMLANNSVTVNTGTGLSGGGGVALGNSLTLNNTGVLSFNGRPGTVTPAMGDYSFPQISGTATTAQLPAAALSRGIVYLAGCDSCSVLTNSDSQRTFYMNVIGGMTINSVSCFSDAGMPTINIQKNGTMVNILNSNLTCSPTGATTTSFSQNLLNLNDTLDFVITADGTAKRVTVIIKATVN